LQIAKKSASELGKWMVTVNDLDDSHFKPIPVPSTKIGTLSTQELSLSELLSILD